MELFQAYELWKEDKGMDFTDPSLDDATSSCKLMTCLQVALLCVQEQLADRPSILEVFSMLRNEAATIARPKKPAFSAKRDEDGGNNSIYNCSVNDASISQMLPQ
ncbi:hypothetical protein L1049_007385 [Liquidambar formosana]|uniref:Uncharacterized protein n=1 Tax=Liquidambar formosana TaxID=63359 RepID=A0AAP0R3D4_LIQFO